MTAIIIFVASLSALIGLGVLKYWEDVQNIKFFPYLRSQADEVVLLGVDYAKALYRSVMMITHREGVHRMLHGATTFMLRVVRFSERKLVAFRRFVKGRQELDTNSEASHFLRSVSDHKSELRRENG